MATIDWTAELLDQLETHGQDRLRPRLEGLTDEDYFWEPVPGCWSVPPAWGDHSTDLVGLGGFTRDYGPDAEPRPVTTIEWRLGHLIEGFASTNVYFGGPSVDAETFDYPGTAVSALASLDEVYPTSPPESAR